MRCHARISINKEATMESNQTMQRLHDTIDNVSPRPSSLLFVLTAMLAGIAIGMVIARSSRES